MNERAVVSSSVDEGRSRDQLSGAFGAEGDMMVPEPIKFEVYEGRFFVAEYQLIEGNLVFHFFVHPGHMKQLSAQELERWWLNGFAACLDVEAQAYFDATAPRLQARYTQEVASWFLKAQGFGYLLDPAAFARAFLSRLDEKLLWSGGPPPASPVATG